MQLTPQQYTFTSDDTHHIVNMSYVIQRSSVQSLEYFMSKEFTNFNLVVLLKELEHSFTPTTNLKITREIKYEQQPLLLQITYINNYFNDEDALIFDREFSKIDGTINVYHNMLVLPLKFQGQGRIKRLFQISLQQYINMNAKAIHIYAGLDGGGHVWGRHGFVAVYKEEVEVILNDARKYLSPLEYEPVERIYKMYYSKSSIGKEFPMRLWAMIDAMKPILRGAKWHGVINLDNPTQLRNFIEYVFRK